MNHFQSLRSYEDFIYNLPSIYPAVITSILVIVRRSAKQAMIVGEVVFTDAYRLTISEIVDFAEGSLIISWVYLRLGARVPGTGECLWVRRNRYSPVPGTLALVAARSLPISPPN